MTPQEKAAYLKKLLSSGGEAKPLQNSDYETPKAADEADPAAPAAAAPAAAAPDEPNNFSTSGKDPVKPATDAPNGFSKLKKRL